MVLDEQHSFGRKAQGAHELAANPQLLVEPGDHRLAENGPSARIAAEGRHQNAVELGQRFLVKDDVIELGAAQTGLAQAEGDGVSGKRLVMLLAREAFLLS